MCEIVIPEIHTFKKLESSQSICNKKQNRRKSFATKTKIVANHLRRKQKSLQIICDDSII